MSKLNPLYTQWDIKYFHNLHKERMHQVWQQSVSYASFYERLKKGMSLKQAIYTPSNTNMKRQPSKQANLSKQAKPSLRFRFISFLKKCQSKSEIQRN